MRRPHVSVRRSTRLATPVVMRVVIHSGHSQLKAHFPPKFPNHWQMHTKKKKVRKEKGNSPVPSDLRVTSVPTGIQCRERLAIREKYFHLQRDAQMLDKRNSLQGVNHANDDIIDRNHVERMFRSLT
ncbi:Uncharacterized protein APZ42_024401 [Daphnia magna]|uniref:Uncharacterized protein n=1 Tax=Daphnia magna TaxID=35525 RepID=A0A162DFG4_9CRUS|nr:Uncharacterized protein APZ42_024401 [Daphnia magna]